MKNIFLAAFMVCLAQPCEADVPKWSVHELTLRADRDHKNPYLDVEIRAEFIGPGGTKKIVRGFWNGDRDYLVRFNPTETGKWTYRVESTPADGGLTTEGEFVVGEAASAEHGFLRRDTRFPTSFSFDDGTRYFMWGTTHYHLLLNARAGDRWKRAIDGAANYNINKVRFSLAPGGRSAKTGRYRASEPFTDEPRTALDLEHWRTADEVVEFLHDRGMVAELILFWRMDETTVDPIKRTADERYLRYAIARYAAYSNVIWCMVNEWNYSSVPRQYWNDLGQLVRDQDVWGRQGDSLRVHSIHQQTRPDWNFADQSWPSHAILQLGVRNRGKSRLVGDEWKAAPKGSDRFEFGDDWGNHSILRNWTGDYPVVNDEFGYIGEPYDDSAGGSKRKNRVVPLTRAKHRRTMWGIAVGGGYATIGDKNDHGEDGSPYFSANWHDAPEYEDVKHLTGFFTRGDVPWWRMRPDNSIVHTDDGRVYALTDPHGRTIVYAATGGSVRVTLGRSDYESRLYDPRTGTTTVLADLTGGGEHRIDLPDSNDWVIDLRP